MRLSLSRRALTGLVAVAVATTVLSAAAGASAAAQQSLAVQSIDTSKFPRMTLRVVLPPEMLAGGMPTSKDFALSENGARVRDVSVRALQDRAEPMYVVLVMDTSGSMGGGALDDAKTAAKGFVDALGQENRIALVEFSDTARVVTPFTQDKPALGAAIDQLGAAHETALYDAISVAAAQFAGVQKGDKAIVLLSDGGDTMSSATLDTTAKALADSGVPLYAVALQTSEYNAGALESLARASGGRLVSVGDSAQLTGMFSAIARQLQSPYEVTYTSFKPPTKDIEIDLLVETRDVRASAQAAVPNPEYSMAEVKPAVAPSTPGAPVTALIAGLAFAAVALGVGGILSLLRREPSTLKQLSYYDQMQQADGITRDSYAVDPKSPQGRFLSIAGTVAAKGGFETAIRNELERAGLPLRPVEYMTLHVALVLGAGILVQALAKNLLITTAAVVIFALAPIAVLANAGRKRLDAFEAQLPDVLNLLASSLRAGWGLLQAVGIVATEIGVPAGPEFGRVMTEARLGMALEDALDKMAARLGSEDFEWAVVAISIQREVGGNLAEVLDNVANTVRERAAIRRQVQSLTAEGRLSAVILLALPIVEAIAIYVVNPAYISVLTSSMIGLASSVGAVFLIIVGAIWLRAIIKIQV